MSRDRLPNSLTEFIDQVGPTEWSVQIVNRTTPEPVEEMIEELFGGLSIDTMEKDHAQPDDNIIALLQDGQVVASSPLSAIRDTLLLVNSDLYKTGTTGIQEIDPPEVIVELSDTVFTLRGYPESSVEKLVLTLVSRYIEHQAWTQGTGTLRSSFQRLSRLNDERGTRSVYERLGTRSELEVSVYGVPDWHPPASMGVTVHGLADDEISRHWFIVYESRDTRSAAMLAVKTGPNEWDGFWTYDPERVQAMNQYITQNLH